MTAVEFMRLAIICSAALVAGLWIYYSLQSHKWLWTIFSLSWLIPVMIFFVVRFLFGGISPQTLNIISLSLYLIGIASLGGVVVAKLKTLRERKGRE